MLRRQGDERAAVQGTGVFINTCTTGEGAQLLRDTKRGMNVLGEQRKENPAASNKTHSSRAGRDARACAHASC